jgi:outer membrane protein assembly factor BamB
MWEVEMTALVYSYDEHLGIGRIYVEPEALYFDATTGEPLSGSDGQWRLAEWNEEAQVWSDSESDGTTHYSLRSGSETRWEATIEPRQRHLAMTPTDVFVSIDDGAYWGSTWSELISIDIATGEERWSSYLEGGIVDGLVVLDDQVLVSVNEHPELCH